jgi:hypothetical protein
VSGTVQPGAGGPSRIESPPGDASAEGRVEAVLDGRVIGWAWRPEEPSERLEVVVVVDDREVATCVADGHRSSLAAAGIGDGAHAFGVELPASLGDRGSHTVRVLAGPESSALPAALAYAVNAGAHSPFAGTAFNPVDHQNGSDRHFLGGSAAAAVADPVRRRRRRVAPRRSPIAAARFDPRAWSASHATTAPYWLLAGGCGAYFLLFLYLTRHFGFFQDEFDFILNRRGWSPGALLAPVNQHLFVLPLIVYKLLFVTVGLRTHWPYQLPAFAMHIAAVVGVYVLASRRAGPWIALVPAALLLVLGAGFELELWAIGMSTLGSLAAGVWALVLLERRDRRGDLWASALIALSIASYSVGLFVAVAIGVELALTRWRRLWIVAVPLALYALWYAQYAQQGDILMSNIPLVPRYDAQVGAYGFAGLSGLSSRVFGHRPLIVGYPLLAAAVIWLVRQAIRRRRPSSLALIGIVAAVGFWTGTALARSQDHQPDVSRYVYPSAVLILVAAVGFLRPVRLRVRTGAAIALAGALIAVLGLQPLEDYSVDRTGTDAYIRTALGAAEVAGNAGDPAFAPDAHHIGFVTLGEYLKAVRDLGSPAYTTSEIALLPSDYQQMADGKLIDAERVDARQSTAAPPAGAACSQLRGATSAGMLEVAIDPGASAYVEAGPDTVRVWLRRISASFAAVPQQTLAPRSRARIDFPRDTWSSPWWLQLATSAGSPSSGKRPAATVCVQPS